MIIIDANHNATIVAGLTAVFQVNLDIGFLPLFLQEDNLS